jgi:hypothetical protein
MCWFLNHTCVSFAVWQFNYSRVPFPMGEGFAAIQRRGGLPVIRGGGSLMTHGAGSVTTQSVAFKYVMAFEPYRYT